MNNKSEQSQYDSSEDEGGYNILSAVPKPSSKIHQKSLSQHENISNKSNLKRKQVAKQVKKKPKLNQIKLEDNEELTLKPRFDHSDSQQQKKYIKQNGSKIMNNASKVTIVSRKNIMNAYTFKRQCSQKVKRHDPVSLYAQTKQSWNRNKFLKGRADAKEGRKLQLDKRNKNIKLL